MTINKKVLVLMVVLLAAIVVTSVNALTVEFVPGGTAYANNEQYINVHVSFPNADRIYLMQMNPSIYHYGWLNGDDVTYNNVQVNGRTITLEASYKKTICDDPYDECIMVYNYYMTVYPGEDPNAPPTPEAPHLKATPMAYDVTFITYQITTEPDDQGYEFSRITTAPQDSQFTNPQWSPAHTLIYSIPRGQTITFYSKAKSLLNTELISISVTAPTGQEDTIINATAPEINPENTERNPPPIPHVTPGSKDNPVNSGKFKPSNSNSNYITPFTQFTQNVKEFMQLPQMDNPQKIKSEILNTTGGNLTAPLYESIDGFTNLLCFPAYFVSDSLNAALSPIEEAINYCDDVLIVILGSVSEFFLSIDTLKSFFYLLIPDFVWWIICTILIFDIIATIMSFIYGRSITFYYLFGFNDKKD